MPEKMKPLNVGKLPKVVVVFPGLEGAAVDTAAAGDWLAGERGP